MGGTSVRNIVQLPGRPQGHALLAIVLAISPLDEFILIMGRSIGWFLAKCSFILLLAAFALMYPAGGMAVWLSQAALIDAAPGDSARVMTRWTMLSSIGDFLSPLAVTAIVAFGLGFLGCAPILFLLLAPRRGS